MTLILNFLIIKYTEFYYYYNILNLSNIRCWKGTKKDLNPLLKLDVNPKILLLLELIDIKDRISVTKNRSLN